MGINQVAFDLLIENPMTGYMNEVIFTRILGHDDIEQGNYWADTTLCYICQKWKNVSYNLIIKLIYQPGNSKLLKLASYSKPFNLTMLRLKKLRKSLQPKKEEEKIA